MTAELAGVTVSARVCAKIERALADGVDQARRLGIELDPEVAATLAAIYAAAATWRACATLDDPRKSADTRAPMTVADVAARLNVSPARVRQRLAAGELRGIRDARGRWRIPPEEVPA